MSGIGNTAPSNTKAVELIHSDPTYSGGHFYPPADNTYDLGSATHSWRNIYVDTIYYGQTGTAEIRIGDADDYFRILAVSNVPTIYGVGAYSRFGDAGTATHVDHEDDVLVSGELEVDGMFWHDLTTDATSAATGAARFLGGVGIAKKLYIGTDLDVNGNTQLDGTLTIGVNDTGHDVIFYGASTGQYLVWDESQNKLLLVGGADFTVLTPGYTDLQGAVGIGGSLVVIGGTTLGVTGIGSLVVTGNTTVAYIGMSSMVCTGNATFSGSDVGVAGTLTVLTNITNGYDGAAGDVTFYTDTAGRYMVWDGSTDKRLEITNAPVVSTITGATAQSIGFTSTHTANVGFTGWALGFFGTTTISATSGTVGNAAGGCFDVNLSATYAATGTGMVCGIYAGAYTNTAAAAAPSAVIICEGIAGSGASEANMPILVLMTSGAGTKSTVAIEFGHAPAAKQVTTGVGGMYHAETIQVRANGNARYIPLSTSQTTFTSANPIAITTTDPEAAVHAIYSVVNAGSSAGWTGSVSAIRARQYITDTGANIGNAYGGWFGVAFNTGMTASPAGLTCGVYAEAHSEVAYTSPSSVAYFQSVSSAAGNQTGMPILVLTSIAGENTDKPKYVMSFGYAAAATTVRTGSGGAYYNNTLQIVVNSDDRYIPLSTAEGMYAVGAGVEGLSAFTYGTLASPLSIAVDTTSVQTPLIIHMNTTTDGTGMTCAAIFGNKAITDNQLRSVQGITTWADFSVNVKCAHGIISNITRTGNVTTENNDSACGFFDMDMGSSTTQCAGRLFAGYFEFAATDNTTANPSSNYSTALMAVSYAMSNSVMYLLHQTTTEVEEAILHIEATAGPAVPKGIFLEETGAGAYTCAIYAEGGYVYFNDILFIGDSNVANTKMTGPGLTIDQSSYSTEILALKSSDVAHGRTTSTETDTYLTMKKRNASYGGILITSYGENDAGQPTNLLLTSIGGQASTIKTISARALVEVWAEQHDGSDGAVSVTANGNVFAVRGYSTSGKALMIVDIDGDVHATDFVAGIGEGGVTALTGGEIRAPNLITGAGTDHVAGCNLAVSPGLGRGTGTLGTVVLNGAVVAAADTVQTLTPCLTIQGTTATFAGPTKVGASGSNITVPDGTFGFQVYAGLASGSSDGLAMYTEGFVSGTCDGAVYGAGIWLQLVASVDLNSQEIRGLDVGIYDAGAVASTGSHVYGICVSTYIGSTLNPATHAMMRFNTDQSGDTPDYWFMAANPECLALVLDTGEAGDKYAAIPIHIQGPGTKYIRVYDSPS